MHAVELSTVEHGVCGLETCLKVITIYLCTFCRAGSTIAVLSVPGGRLPRLLSGDREPWWCVDQCSARRILDRDRGLPAA